MAGRKKIHTDEVNPEVRRLYEKELLSMYAIGLQLEMHPQVVKRKLISMGIYVRNKSEAMTLFYSKQKKSGK